MLSSYEIPAHTTERSHGLSEPTPPWALNDRADETRGSALAALAGTPFSSRFSLGRGCPGGAMFSPFIRRRPVQRIATRSCWRPCATAQAAATSFPCATRAPFRSRSSLEPCTNYENSARAWSSISICSPLRQKNVRRPSPISRLRRLSGLARQALIAFKYSAALGARSWRAGFLFGSRVSALDGCPSHTLQTR